MFGTPITLNNAQLRPICKGLRAIIGVTPPLTEAQKTSLRKFLTFWNNPRKTHTGVWISTDYGRQFRL
jgi:hypothetical protein